MTHIRSTVMENASKYESNSRMKKEDIDFVLEKLKVSRQRGDDVWVERGNGRGARGTVKDAGYWDV